MEQTRKLTKNETHAILQSLRAGTVPKVGLKYVVVGREEEIKQIHKELHNVKQGTSGFKIIMADYGNGKTFMLRLARGFALEENFVVADADFNPERRFTGTSYGLNLYRELIKNLATPVRSDNAIESIIEKWLSNVQSAAQKKLGMSEVKYDDQVFVKEVSRQIDEQLTHVEELSGGFSFREVIKRYYTGYARDNDDLRRSALKWLRGEYSTRTDAKRDLGVRDIITDDNWFDYIKLINRFVKGLGYSGLVVILDEAVSLYKISHTGSREKNYEALLNIYNDTTQGNIDSLYFIIGDTIKGVQDDRRGLYSYEALKSRLKTNPFEDSKYKDYSQNVIALPGLKAEHYYVLLKKLKLLHDGYCGSELKLSDSQLQSFVLGAFRRPGASQNLSSREVIKRFLDAINILAQNPGMPVEKVLTDATTKERSADDIKLAKSDEELEPEQTVQADPMSRFEKS